MKTPVAGINISKDKLIVYFQGKFYEFPNDKQGFEEVMPRGCKVGIKSTGVYHVNLAKYEVRVINPLVIKKFKDFRGKKSDKNDAKKLAELVVNM
ncbi:Hypothetical protein SSO6659 [Saccharolobus solfataricus P2]|uniref:Transposase IS110-like N-terminal domain-containing protein n=2 Tax=Saccharolobus solfataricus TaxID=2287 RepID=Q97ZP2_SACS2|nr:Hypothetical protein SSO6659 [Saccharolobus solfataricus P2]SAI84441.1 ORF1 in transposon ISC1190 [Saccharolobus solfataricus]